MRLNAKTNSPTSPLLALLVAAFPSSSHAHEPFIQADVYNTLYEANVQCDDNLDLSRSEFITDEFERNGRNRVSMELLTKSIAHNVRTARKSIGEKAKEREFYTSEMLRTLKVSSDETVDEAKASKEHHERIRQIDAFLKRERRYVEVRECVLAALERTSRK